jgi:D-alanyl-D-alanine carboxypeptidase
MKTWIVGLILCSLTLTAVAGQSGPSTLSRHVDNMIQASVDARAPGVAFIIAQDDQILYRGARGLASVELNAPLKPDQVFRIGSITKVFTAAAIMKLSADGKLALNDPLSKFLPDFPNGAHITLAELLSHTSGVSDNWDTDPAKPIDTNQTVKLIASASADFPPGAAWSYSNSGYMLLGAVIEKVTGKPWHEFIREQFVTPLGLIHTGFYSDEAVVPNKVTGYSEDEHGKVVLAPFVTITGPGAAGALVSNIDDLFQWMRALTTNRALPNNLYQVMSSSAMTQDGQHVNYGDGLMLGTVRGEPIVEHNGQIEGFSAQIVYFPRQHVTVVVLANTDAGNPNPRSLAHRLGALAIGNAYPDFKAIPLSVDKGKELTGTYSNGLEFTHKLSFVDETLTIQRAGGPIRKLALSSDETLFYPNDRTDYIKVIRDKQHHVIALDFYADGMPPARREPRSSP